MMKPVLILLISAGALASSDSFATAKKCSLTTNLPGHRDVAEAHYKRDWQGLAKSFKKFCDDNKKKIHCSTIPSEKAQSEAVMRGLVQGHPCAEAMNATEGQPPVIYFVDEN